MAKIDRRAQRIKRHRRLRKRIHGTPERPRLCVAKTLRHIHVQIIDDDARCTLAAASTRDVELRGETPHPNMAAAEKVGLLLAKRALENGVEAVVFDKGGYPYHGVVAALAEACRKGGMRF